ncbi:hypothetical protein [Georgenia sp. H159]|uniref:hypothetical protein n=1 Tax=Georgenia sp. H159 TaxID=3076115 RepID=UPI002D7A1064|nr:hypothetical protein [Georgenia sp. H159]
MIDTKFETVIDNLRLEEVAPLAHIGAKLGLDTSFFGEQGGTYCMTFAADDWDVLKAAKAMLVIYAVGSGTGRAPTLDQEVASLIELNKLS